MGYLHVIIEDFSIIKNSIYVDQTYIGDLFNVTTCLIVCLIQALYLKKKKKFNNFHRILIKNIKQTNKNNKLYA